MRTLALACVLLRVTPPSPVGPIGDMASAPGGLRAPLWHLPAPDATFKNTKHILRAAEFLRDLVAKARVAMGHLPERVMIADLMTKACARVTYIELLRLIDSYARDGVACPA